MSKALTTVAFDHCLDSESHKLLWQKVTNISIAWLLELPSLHCVAPVTMFPKWQVSHRLVWLWKGPRPHTMSPGMVSHVSFNYEEICLTLVLGLKAV